MKALLIVLALLLSGCATPVRTWGLAVGAALVAGAAATHEGESTSAAPNVHTPGNPCATNPAVCR